MLVVPGLAASASLWHSRVPASTKPSAEVTRTGDTGNMAGDTNIRTGQCHCGAVRFEATLSDGLNSILRCTCSYCRMRGAVVAMAKMGGIKILQGDDALTSYRFHTGSAQHFFCSRCGIYTHHQRRSDQNSYAVNVACLDGISPFDFPEVPVIDGVNHTSDTGMPTRPAGTLRFIPADQSLFGSD
jgi:hypothetical protein